MLLSGSSPIVETAALSKLVPDKSTRFRMDNFSSIVGLKMYLLSSVHISKSEKAPKIVINGPFRNQVVTSHVASLSDLVRSILRSDQVLQIQFVQHQYELNAGNFKGTKGEQNCKLPNNCNTETSELN